MTALDRKLLRDLWRIKGQAGAIVAVVAVGILLLVMMTGLLESLTETRAAYYERYRLADVFAPAARVPEHLDIRISALPGVAAVEGRITGQALLNLDTRDLPVQARAISLPDGGRPVLNDIYLSEGRIPQPARADEILLLRSFAKAHGLAVGDTLRATFNGSRRSFRIVGLAQSPEFLYTAAPGELVPDDSRFGVLWMGRAALAAAYDMEGAVNEFLVMLGRGASAEDVLAALDRLLAPYGGTGAYTLENQFSNRFISEEIEGLGTSASVVPPIFLLVAAFLLWIVIGRIVQAEREEIGLMKAFGYTSLEVTTHYFKMVLVIAVLGAVIGSLLGIAAGRAMTSVYLQFYKFPFLVFRLDPASFATGAVASIVAASLGAVMVLRGIFALSPATAMRPPAPPDYSRVGEVGRGLNRWLDQPTRMVIRRVTRQPLRMAGAAVGVACGMALSAAMTTIHAGFDRTIDLTFSAVDRSDLAVTFTHAISEKTMFELLEIDGIRRVEPVRYVAAVLSNGTREYRGALTGLPADSDLYRALDARSVPIDLPANGVVLSVGLAEILGMQSGGTMTVDVREGRQPLLTVPVSRISDTLIGSPAYMRLDALNRLLREPGRVSGAYVTVDAAKATEIYRHLRDLPTVAGVSDKNEAREAIIKVMNTGAGATRFVMAGIAFVITFGIVYNVARIALAERIRDLASLRIMGFTRGETAYVLLGELAIVILVALPLGSALAYYLAQAIAWGFSTEFYRIPAFYAPRAHGMAALVVLFAGLVSGGLVKRDLDRADLIGVLKTRE